MFKFQFSIQYNDGMGLKAGIIEAWSPTDGLLKVLATSNQIIFAEVYGVGETSTYKKH